MNVLCFYIQIVKSKHDFSQIYDPIRLVDNINLNRLIIFLNYK